MAFIQVANFLVFGIAGKLGAPLYVINNLIGQIGDKIMPNTLFCLNFAMLAQKK
jgi:hypothetical protein